MSEGLKIQVGRQRLDVFCVSVAKSEFNSQLLFLRMPETLSKSKNKTMKFKDLRFISHPRSKVFSVTIALLLLKKLYEPVRSGTASCKNCN